MIYVLIDFINHLLSILKRFGRKRRLKLRSNTQKTWSHIMLMEAVVKVAVKRHRKEERRARKLPLL